MSSMQMKSPVRFFMKKELYPKHAKKRKLLDINSEQEIPAPKKGTASDDALLPAEKGVAFCNRLFFGNVFIRIFLLRDGNRSVRKKNLLYGKNSGAGWIRSIQPDGVNWKKR